MKIEVSSNADEVIRDLNTSLTQYQKGIKLTVFRALTLLEAEIMQNIRTKSGLKVRSGTLLNSVPSSKKVTDVGGIIEGEIGTTGVPYAAIHEFGGTTKPHIIQPRNKKVLAFESNNQTVFARFVNHPGSVIPARPYLRPAIAAKKDQILETFGVLIQSAFGSK